MPQYRQTHTINMPVHMEEGWRRLKASYPQQSFGGLVMNLLTQYFLKTGFLFEEEIPKKMPLRPERMTGETRTKKRHT